MKTSNDSSNWREKSGGTPAASLSSSSAKALNARKQSGPDQNLGERTPMGQRRSKKRERKDVYIGLRVPSSLHRQILAAAEADKRSVSSAVRVLLEQKLSASGA
jgi:hypothetical protein